jgi:DNA-binding NarL/FixJ family response regulator
MSVPTRVVIADDHPLVRQGLTTLLGAMDGFEIVGEAADGRTAIHLVTEHEPDVVVMDLNMPGLDGIEATRRIATNHPGTAVLVLTMFDDDDSLFSALRAGARGYVLKGSPQEDVQRALVGCARGDAVFGPAIASRVLDWFAAPARTGPVFPELTSREREVLELVARGVPNQAISERLGVALKTVRNHLSNIFTKLHVSDRAEAIARAREEGLGPAL